MKQLTRACCLIVLTLCLFTSSLTAQSTANRWNRTMLNSIAANPPAPTKVTWRLHLMSSAMYDAWAAYDTVALGTIFGDLPRRPASEHTIANKEAATSYAAYRALMYVYPDQAEAYEALMDDLGYPLSDSRDPSTPAGIGNLMADAAYSSRLNDGSNVLGGFEQVTSADFPELYEPVNSADPLSPMGLGGADFNPNRWTPLRVPNGTATDMDGNPIVIDDDPSTFTDQTNLTPHWGAVRPFALTSGSQFLPQAPPMKGSPLEYTDALGAVMTNDEAWNSQTDEVIEFSRDLTILGKISAEFWADGPRTWTPPGHWNQFAEGLSQRDQHTIDDDIKMFFALNAALYDAAISSWDAKRRFDYIRPISAIRSKYFGQTIEAWAGPNNGTQQIAGETWSPYQSSDFVTPAFAEYVSGHSTFSRAARETLFAYTGSDAFFDGVTRYDEDFDGDGENDLLGEHITVPGGLLFEDGPTESVVLRWNTLLEAADAAGESRRFGGIHFQDGDIFGRRMGEQIGQQAYARAEQLWSGIDPGSSTDTCIADANTLCIDGRWKVQAMYSTTLSGSPSSGFGAASSLANMGVNRGGLFSFFEPSNPELLVKVLDGCGVNGHFWASAAAATNVGFTLQVTDVTSGAAWTNTNVDGSFHTSVVDVTAFPCS